MNARDLDLVLRDVPMVAPSYTDRACNHCHHRLLGIIETREDD